MRENICAFRRLRHKARPRPLDNMSTTIISHCLPCALIGLQRWLLVMQLLFLSRTFPSQINTVAAALEEVVDAEEEGKFEGKEEVYNAYLKRNCLFPVRRRFATQSTSSRTKSGQRESDMKDEVNSAVSFLSKMLATRPAVTGEQSSTFRDTLEKLITAKFENHWHPNQPLRGNAFRCLNIDTVTNTIDPLLVKAAQICEVSPLRLSEVFPDGLDLWIDPGDVSCRVGRGDIWPIYQHSHPLFQQQPKQWQALVPTQLNRGPTAQLNRGPTECSNYMMKRSRYPRSRRYNEEYDKYHWVKEDGQTAQLVC